MSEKQLQVNFRMPERLKKQLEASAISNDRSLTAEINARLKGSFHSEISIKTLDDSARSSRKQLNQLRKDVMSGIPPEKWEAVRREVLDDLIRSLQQIKDPND